MRRHALVAFAASACVAHLGGCASDDYAGSSGSVSSHTAFYYGSPWYGNPYYYYDDPDYVVVPPDRPDQLPVRPENPIAELPPGERPRPTPLPAERPRVEPLPSDRASSRMPKAQPRTSTPRARPSIPSAPRGGGFSRGGGRRR